MVLEAGWWEGPVDATEPEATVSPWFTQALAVGWEEPDLQLLDIALKQIGAVVELVHRDVIFASRTIAPHSEAMFHQPAAILTAVRYPGTVSGTARANAVMNEFGIHEGMDLKVFGPHEP